MRQRVARQAKEANTPQAQAVAPNPFDIMTKPAEEAPAPPPPVESDRPALASGFRVETSAPPLRPQPIREAPANPEASPVVDAITSFFTGGNLLVKSGIIILFFGVSFLVKYAAEHGHVPIQLRLAATAFGGIVLLATGWRLRQKRAEYALALQGGGIGILFLTTYAAFRLFALLSPTSSFILLVAISGLCGALAVLQSSRTLALFGISGGFIAPLLASIGNGNPAFLFGYYAVLNAGIVGIAWYRSWRALTWRDFYTPSSSAPSGAPNSIALPISPRWNRSSSSSSSSMWELPSSSPSVSRRSLKESSTAPWSSALPSPPLPCRPAGACLPPWSRLECPGCGISLPGHVHGLA